MLPQEFILFSNQEALRYLNSHKKLNPRHAKWVEFLQEYTFVLKHKVKVENKATNALSQKITLLHSMSIQVTEFEKLKEDYNSCPDFGDLYATLMSARSNKDYPLHNGYLFRGTQLCIPYTSVCDFLAWELHVGSIASHFGCNKTIAFIDDRFY